MRNLTKGIVFSAIASFGSLAYAADYSIDAGHSTVQFVIGHLGVSQTIGRFNTFSGDFSFDNDNPSAASVTLMVDTASIDTNHEKRDEHLASPDFLDVKQFPEMTFKSTAYEGTAEAGKLTGELTLHGVTKSVTFDVQKIGEGNDPWGGYRAGFNAQTTLNRSEFGITNFIPGVSDETQVNIFIEGIRK
ncbi:YceI family protein [Balneatrix alpica]|uniref:YceI family protein n=1 Tax=Balneatrix alpica TaxID=75684 RepID=A0ABV5Z942_9GAMM|nr:YceI family protein [Balneatrix alpica]